MIKEFGILRVFSNLVEDSEQNPVYADGVEKHAGLACYLSLKKWPLDAYIILGMIQLLIERCMS